ncbi:MULTISPECIES: heme NO-binding domain-containing protein [unclassified Thioalkalivibrio]|uniref:heme NO-binding domain-containing protein n=1 Tax=unclassified Thioalkalivibrio TaxID=2621013 RepID=UPI000372771B|nr:MULTISPECIES: heme NO-binding domain-containing protein [unclassified Thioalkalivibrio]
MKGIVFNVLEEIVTEHYGEEGWEDLLDRAQVSGAYTSLGNYEDDEMMRLVGAACEVTGLNTADCLQWIGREMLPRFEQAYPGVFDHYPDSIGLLQALNDVIHPEVVKLYPGARVPVFDCTRTGPQELAMDYRSERGLCSLAHGLMLGTGDRYGQTVHVEHPECQHRGDGRCHFQIHVEPNVG